MPLMGIIQHLLKSECTRCLAPDQVLMDGVAHPFKNVVHNILIVMRTPCTVQADLDLCSGSVWRQP